MNNSLRILFLSLFILSACGFLSGTSPEVHIENARTYIADQRLEAAILELKNALKKESNLPEARFLLGEIYLLYKNGAAAETEFQKARQLGHQGPELDTKILKSLLFKGEFEEVIDRTADVGDENVDMLILRGNAMLASGNRKDARSMFNRALAADSKSVEARIGLAELAMQEKQVSTAVELAEEAQTLVPDSLDVWIIKGKLALLQKNAVEAEEAFRKAVSIAGYSTVAQFGLARALIIQGEIDKARSPLDDVEKLYPGHPLATFFRGLIALIDNDIEKTKLNLLRVLKLVPSHAESLLLLSRIYFEEGQLEQAKEYISTFIMEHPDHVPALKLLSIINLGLKQTDEALANLDKARANARNDGQLLALLGSAYMQNGDVSKGNELLTSASELDSASPSVHTQLALGHLMVGETDIAISRLKSAIELDPELVRADILLVLTHLRDKNYSEAIRAAEDLALKQPDNPLAPNLIGAAYFEQDKLDRAAEYFQKAYTLDPTFSPAVANLAKIELRNGKIKRAEDLYLGILEQDDTDQIALTGLARIEARRGNMEKMKNLLEKVRSNHPIALSQRIMLGNYYLQHEQVEDLLQVMTEALEIAPDNPEALLLMGQAQRLNRNPEGSIESLKKLIKLEPDSHNALFQLSMTQFQTGNKKAGKDTLNQILELEPGHVGALSASARLALGENNHELAKEYLARIRKTDDQASVADILQGDILLAENRSDEATEIFEKIAKTDNDGLVTRKLAYSYQLSGKIPEAVETLKKWLEEDPGDLNVRLFLSSLYQKTKDKEKAIRELNTVLEQDPDNTGALNNLAWLYLDENPSLALEMARKAHVQLPNRAEIQDTLGWILIKQGKVEEGMGHIRAALSSSPDSPDIRYHFATGTIYSGNIDRGRRELMSLLDEYEDFSSRDEAESLLESLP